MSKKIFIIISLVLLFSVSVIYTQSVYAAQRPDNIKWRKDIGNLHFHISNPDVGRCGWCTIPPWRSDIVHTNVVLSIKGVKELMNLHIGKYSSTGKDRCLVIYNSHWPSICWNICYGDFGTWQYFVILALTTILAALGIYIAWNILSIIPALALAF